MTLEQLQLSNCILFECISGSRAYGLHTPESDFDIRGVFVLPKEQYYSLDYVAQVNNESNDIVYYELRRFVELCTNNNPNILELLTTPDDCIRYKHPLLERFTVDMFLSRKCEQSFANYAYSQIKKSRGLEKKIVNPVEKERKSVLDFCFVYSEGRSVELKEYLNQIDLLQENCGLSRLPHMRDCYALHHSLEIPYKGIMKKDTSNDISLSEIPKGEKALALMYFNKDGYSSYCKKYREYWEWVGKRNELRYQSTQDHGKKYDAKNMMHTFRLLHMAREIATEGLVRVRRPDRQFLLAIKNGQREYDELLEQAEILKNELEALFADSNLPEFPDRNAIERTLFEVREAFYTASYEGPPG